jgi:sugar lactone lactonase YvrE
MAFMQHRISLALLTATVAVSIGGLADATAGERDGHGDRGDRHPSVYTLPADAVLPEGIAREDDDGDTFFVSSAGNGAISKGDLDRPALVPFSPAGADGRVAATGMQSDGRGRLFVSGAATGKAFVVSTRNASTLKVLDSRPGAAATFVNDVALTPGYAYFTDSFRPVILRVARRGNDIGELEPWLDLSGTPFVYGDGFNANGIASFDDGRVLAIVQSNTGKLFRVDTKTREVTQIDLGGTSLTFGDGLVADGRDLFVVLNDKKVLQLRLRRDLRSGTLENTIAIPDSMFPTTAIRDGKRLLVVNSQLDNAGQPFSLPFTVSAVRVR